MIKSVSIAIICLGVLFSVQAAVAEEELPLPEGKKLRRKSKVPTYLPLWKGQKVHQNSKVPTYLPI